MSTHSSDAFALVWWTNTQHTHTQWVFSCLCLSLIRQIMCLFILCILIEILVCRFHSESYKTWATFYFMFYFRINFAFAPIGLILFFLSFLFTSIWNAACFVVFTLVHLLLCMHRMFTMKIMRRHWKKSELNHSYCVFFGSTVYTHETQQKAHMR